MDIIFIVCLGPSSLSSVASYFTEEGLNLNWKLIKGFAESIVIEVTTNDEVMVK